MRACEIRKILKFNDHEVPAAGVSFSADSSAHLSARLDVIGICGKCFVLENITTIQLYFWKMNRIQMQFLTLFVIWFCCSNSYRFALLQRWWRKERREGTWATYWYGWDDSSRRPEDVVRMNPRTNSFISSPPWREKTENWETREDQTTNNCCVYQTL